MNFLPIQATLVILARFTQLNTLESRIDVRELRCEEHRGREEYDYASARRDYLYLGQIVVEDHW